MRLFIRIGVLETVLEWMEGRGRVGDWDGKKQQRANLSSYIPHKYICNRPHPPIYIKQEMEKKHLSLNQTPF